MSLPLAVVAVVYFINHRYSGIPLWDLRGVSGVHELVWIISFISFFFLYPSTFNILEVAAVDKPKLHMWETGGCAVLGVGLGGRAGLQGCRRVGAAGGSSGVRLLWWVGHASDLQGYLRLRVKVADMHGC